MAKKQKQLVLAPTNESGTITEQLESLIEDQNLSDRRPDQLVWLVEKPTNPSNPHAAKFNIVIQDFFIPEGGEEADGYFRWLAQTSRLGGMDGVDHPDLTDGDQGFYFGKVNQKENPKDARAWVRGKQYYIYYKEYDVRIPFVL